jgi:hypothetical protein
MYPGRRGVGDIVPRRVLYEGTGEARSISASALSLSEEMAVPASPDRCSPSAATYSRISPRVSFTKMLLGRTSVESPGTGLCWLYLDRETGADLGMTISSSASSPISSSISFSASSKAKDARFKAAGSSLFDERCSAADNECSMYGFGGLRSADRVLSVKGLDWAEEAMLSSRSGVTGRSEYVDIPFMLRLDSVGVMESTLRWLPPLL